MPVQIVCPNCSGALRVPEDLFGKRVQCPTCEAIFIAEVGPQPVEPSSSQRPTAANGDGEFVRRREYRATGGHYLLPHRGGLILGLGIASMLICVPLGLPLGLCAYVMGTNDLNAMRLGTMDPAGQGHTQAGQICGIIGAVVMVLGCCGVGSIRSLIGS